MQFIFIRAGSFSFPIVVAEIMKKVLKKEIHEGIAPDKGIRTYMTAYSKVVNTGSIVNYYTT